MGQHQQPDLPLHPRQTSRRQSTQFAVFLAVGKHPLDLLLPPPVDPLAFGAVEPLLQPLPLLLIFVAHHHPPCLGIGGARLLPRTRLAILPRTAIVLVLFLLLLT